MEGPATPSNETERQACVTALGLTSPEVEESFDRITRLLAQVLEVPITAFSLIDGDRQFFKSCTGLNIQETPRQVSFCGHTILQDDILVIEDATQHSGFRDNPLVQEAPHIGFYAGIPVRSPEGHKVGSLCAIDNRARAFTESMKQFIIDLRTLLENELLLRSEAIRDHLTGLYNRRHFDAVLDQEWRRALRLEGHIGLVLADIDYFKSYNDRYGHHQGDACLQRVARALRSQCRRAGDVVFRLGGEEFAILIPDSSEYGTRDLGERAKRAVKELNLPHQGAPLAQVTLSAGAVTAKSAQVPSATPKQFSRKADSLLYEAKARGRDLMVADFLTEE
ncbi:diguanylate cyclase domain-containing protein [Thiohalorhabdus sp. Cl-TMA]|uniref:diguanylate cyclase n=1 Tax=Thiohalorhabdus methylotrophus TaxID=3242694 RepID=A0ABV4TWL5_9GAMM